MTKKSAIRLFNDKTIHTHWDDDVEKWYFSIIDVIAVLTESENPQTYWRVLKKRRLDEGNQTITNCNALNKLAETSTTVISKKDRAKEIYRE